MMQIETASEFVGEDVLLPTGLNCLVFKTGKPSGPTVRLYAVGDICLSGRVAQATRRYGYSALFESIAPFLRTGDIVFGNLESPLVDSPAPGQMFAGDPAIAPALRDGGFTLLHLANNHATEYGAAGLATTLAAIQQAGIMALGAGVDERAARAPVRTDVNGLRIGWLGCGYTRIPQTAALGPRYWEFDEADLLASMRSFRSEVEVLIVSIHIGLMLLDYPRPEHKAMAERLMAEGADLVLMHHAHVLQGVDVTPHGVCCYNLGNFVFDSLEGNVPLPMQREQNEGAIFAFDLDQTGVATAIALPIFIDTECRIRWATEERGSRILQRLMRISQALQGDYVADFERQRAERNAGHILSVFAFHAKRGNWRFVLSQVRYLRWEHVKMLMGWLRAKLRPTPG